MSRNAAPEPADQLLAVNEVRFLGVQDTFKRPALQPEDVISVALHGSDRVGVS